LEPGEFLPENWPIEGTSGYDFLNVMNGLLVRPEGLAELTRIYEGFTGEPVDFPAIAHEKKIAVTQEALGSDVNRLTSLFVEICEDNRNERDYTRAEARRALREVAACFGVYRTYVVPERGELTVGDRERIAEATERAKANRPDIDGGIFDFLRDVLTMAVKGKRETEFLMRFQQFTSPVMAKGVEDTAFYCYNRLVGLNEVGSDPGRNGVSVAEFHAYQERMHATRPLTMTTLSTHDTKRADDVRARLAVLTEVPEEFQAAVERWAKRNAELLRDGLPDRNTEWFYYQTLVGAWPLTADRAKAYMQKATREAKQRTSWVANDQEFEAALEGFIEATLSSGEFVEDLERFVERVKGAGWVNSLAQTLVKYTAPGVPDLYQGGELWDLSLVDPDNRRPVDYALRRELLNELAGLSVPEAAALAIGRMDEGLPKLWLVHRALELRLDRPKSFGAVAGYRPLEVTGKMAEHAVAYLRGEDVVTVVPRLTLTLGRAWQSAAVALPEGVWMDWLTGAVHRGWVEVEALLKDFPVALLVREG
jgi:(1->4)-alpha-D-glucan 1-alpha-D-glucosylmutase